MPARSFKHLENALLIVLVLCVVMVLNFMRMVLMRKKIELQKMMLYVSTEKFFLAYILIIGISMNLSNAEIRLIYEKILL